MFATRGRQCHTKVFWATLTFSDNTWYAMWHSGKAEVKRRERMLLVRTNAQIRFPVASDKAGFGAAC